MGFRFKAWMPPVFVIGVFVVVWALIYAPWGDESAPAWVQAVGSVFALIGAIWLPIIHSEHAEKNKKARVIGQLRMIAEDCYEQMWEVTSLFSHPGRDAAVINAYLRNGCEKKFLPVERAVAGFAIADVPPEHISSFSVLQRAVEQTSFVISLLPAWSEEGSCHPEITVAFRASRDLLGLIKAQLEWPAGVTDSGDKHFQIRYAALEARRPPLEPMFITGAKVFRRYSWGGENYPSHVHYQIVYPYGDEHPVEHLLEADFPPGWRDIRQAESVVRKAAEDEISYEYNRWL